jgi:hypothetical protein
MSLSLSLIMMILLYMFCIAAVLSNDTNKHRRIKVSFSSFFISSFS